MWEICYEKSERMLVNRGIETFFPGKVVKDGGAHVYYQGERPLNG